MKRDHVIWAKFGENAWFTTNTLLTREKAEEKVARFEQAHATFNKSGRGRTRPLYEVRKAAGV